MNAVFPPQKIYPGISIKNKYLYLKQDIRSLIFYITGINEVEGIRRDNETRCALIPRDFRGLFIAGDVLEVDPVVFQTTRVIVIRVIVVVLLARFRSCCRAASAVAAAADAAG